MRTIMQNSAVPSSAHPSARKKRKKKYNKTSNFLQPHSENGQFLFCCACCAVGVQTKQAHGWIWPSKTNANVHYRNNLSHLLLRIWKVFWLDSLGCSVEVKHILLVHFMHEHCPHSAGSPLPPELGTAAGRTQMQHIYANWPEASVPGRESAASPLTKLNPRIWQSHLQLKPRANTSVEQFFFFNRKRGGKVATAQIRMMRTVHFLM